MPASLFLLCFLGVCLCSELVLQPPSTTGTHTALVFVGRNDTDISSYVPLASAIQKAASPSLSLWVIVRSDLSGVEDSLAKIQSTYAIEDVFFASYSMTENAGVAVQKYAKLNSGKVKAVVLIAGFLQRNQRPDIQDCLKNANVLPKKTFKCPLGCLTDGVHDCFGPNKPSYPLPTLSIGGELDGVVRVTRFAEAYYTQQDNNDLPVVVVEGMNHGILLNTSLPPSVKSRDLQAECTQTVALSTVASAVASFLTNHTAEVTGILHSIPGIADSPQFFAPLITAFVKQEGSWFFVGGDEEHGSSPWAGSAQKLLVDPLPQPYTWTLDNEYHMLSDEEKIPPYYRHKHRGNTTKEGNQLVSSTIAQLRYLKQSVTQTAVGLNGNAIIKEEKINILTAFPDDGAREVSTIEIATKFRSRQYIFNITGNPANDTLDTGNQCQMINQEAYNWALNASSPSARARFAKYGVPLVMVPDKKPTVPAGPWFIWSYLQYTPKAKQVEVAAYYTFFPLTASSYGAGTHYCKLLSPSRAMEWIYVDGLRGL